MKLEFLIGSEKTFEDFISSISKEDKVGIIVHKSDLDGHASGIFLEEILKSKGIKSIQIILKSISPNETGLLSELKGLNLDKLIVADIPLESYGELEELQKEFDLLLIDHHPIQNEIRNQQGVIKTNSSDCASWTIYSLGTKLKLLSSEKWKKLVQIALYSEFSYKGQNEKLSFIQKDFPEITEENIRNSEIGKLGDAISQTIIYFEENLEKAYQLIKNLDFKRVLKYSQTVKEEIERLKKEFEEKAEFHEKERIYFFETLSRLKVESFLATEISQENPDCIYFIFKEKEGTYKFSTRCQSGRVDLNSLIKKSIEGLENAGGGGHAKASAGYILKEDLRKFKENLLKP